MEFYVVDPKTGSYQEWNRRIGEFLKEQNLKHQVIEGGLYYIGDDIAVPWNEASMLYTVEGEYEGVIEVRDSDNEFYIHASNMEFIDETEFQSRLGYRICPSGVIYGFTKNDQKGCRFHTGPSKGLSFFCEEDLEVPKPLPLKNLWNLFFTLIRYLNNNISRIQDLKKFHLDKLQMDFEVSLSFPHAASLDMLTEILADEQGYERSRNKLQAIFKKRELDWVQHFVSLLPTDQEDFSELCFRAIWQGKNGKENVELISVGVERRLLKPFIQLPLHRTSKRLMELFRAHFRGHRIDRQEYCLESYYPSLKAED